MLNRNAIRNQSGRKLLVASPVLIGSVAPDADATPTLTIDEHHLGRHFWLSTIAIQRVLASLPAIKLITLELSHEQGLF